jgi:signal transduction histidine kinase
MPVAGPPALETDELRGVLRDYMEVTQRLQETHERLQHEVMRLRKEVQSKDRELERRRRLASLGELAAGVAHEVRNPLGAIQLYSGLLRRELGEPGPALALVEKIDAGINAIECVVQDTLALAPRGGGFERRSLREIVEGACDACRATLDGCGVQVELHQETQEVEVPADGTSLQRVFVNLIANAAQASPRGGTVTVTLGTDRDGEGSASVADRGPGLSDDTVDKIFDPFFTTKENGTGLGLTIAHRLVEAHGGNLSARNRSGGGAEFVVVLPTSSSEKEERAPQAGAGQPSAA